MEEGSDDCDDEGHLWLGQAELVEVVKMSEAKDEWREEDGCLKRSASAEEKRHSCRAKETLFCARPLITG